MIEHYKQYEPLFGEWRINKLIGKGSFGEVYEIERSNFGTTYKAALKVVTIPVDDGEIQELMACGMTVDETRHYMEQSAKHIVSEFVLMSKLKGHTNIVSYEDHQVIERGDKMGWDIMMKMELLEPINEYIKRRGFSAKDIARLGRDLATGLSLCQKYQIIHRDIKPENIFVSPNGDFKLGDFGVARNVERATMGLSKKGTYTYMAPEIYRGENYTMSVDIYSLGIVMYKLANYNRIPFMPPYPESVMYTDRENAFARRMKGDRLPNPIAISDVKLIHIIQRCCEFESKDRYQDIEDIIHDLSEAIDSQSEKYIIEPTIEKEPVKKVIIKDKNNIEDTALMNMSQIESIVNNKEKSNTTEPKNNIEEYNTRPIINNRRESNRKIIAIIIFSVVAIVFIFICIILLGEDSNKPDKDDVVNIATPTPTETMKPTPIPIPKPEPKPTLEPMVNETKNPEETELPTSPEPTTEPTSKPEPIKTPKPAAVATSKPTPVKTPKPAVATPKPAPVATQKPKPVATPKPEPVATPKPEPVATPKPEPVATPKPEPVATPEPEPTPVPTTIPNQNKPPEILTDF